MTLYLGCYTDAAHPNGLKNPTGTDPAKPQ